jgi:phytoene synthase
VDVSATWAYARCEAITRAEARNFYYGIRLLDPPRRQALCAIYALARRIDDIGDGAAPVERRLAELAEVRAALTSLETHRDGPDPVLAALADAVGRWPIPVPAFLELVEGCEMDCVGQRYATFEDLTGYCRRVAGSIGRLSLGVFGSREPARATYLADQLGIALQVTNILRDVVEDRDVMGRVYLPEEDLERFGVAPDLSGPPDALGRVIRQQALRARRLYAEGFELLDLLDRRSRACTGAMAGIYRRVLSRIEQHPEAVLHARVSLSPLEKGVVAVAALSGRHPGRRSHVRLVPGGVR